MGEAGRGGSYGARIWALWTSVLVSLFAPIDGVALNSTNIGTVSECKSDFRLFGLTDTVRRIHFG